MFKKTYVMSKTHPTRYHQMYKHRIFCPLAPCFTTKEDNKAKTTESWYPTKYS